MEVGRGGLDHCSFLPPTVLQHQSGHFEVSYRAMTLARESVPCIVLCILFHPPTHPPTGRGHLQPAAGHQGGLRAVLLGRIRLPQIRGRRQVGPWASLKHPHSARRPCALRTARAMVAFPRHAAQQPQAAQSSAGAPQPPPSPPPNFRYLADEQAAGQFGHLGVTNFDVQRIADMTDKGGVKVECNQVRIRVKWRNEGAARGGVRQRWWRNQGRRHGGVQPGARC